MNISATDTKLSIPKFNGKHENFETWKKQFMAYAIKKGYTNLVKKAANSINEDVEANVAPNEMSKNIEMHADLILLLDDNNIDMISMDDNLSGVISWKRILNVYDKKDVNTALAKQNELMKCKFEDTGDLVKLQNYLNSISTLIGKLRAYNFMYTEAQIICQILAGLPESFESFSTSYTTANSLENIGLEEFKQKLVSYYKKKITNSSAYSKPNAAFSVAYGQTNYNQHQRNINRNNKNRNHNNNNSYDNNKNKSKKNILCENCGKKGHYKNQCWAKGGGMEGKAPWQKKRHNANHIEQKPKSNIEIAFMMEESPTITRAYLASNFKDYYLAQTHNEYDIEFLLDSAATIHMVNDKNLFISFKEEKREILQAINSNNNNNVTCAGIGTIQFVIVSDKNSITVTCEDTLYIPDLRRNLLSVGTLHKRGVNVDFTNLLIQTPNSTRIPFSHDKVRNLFVLYADYTERKNVSKQPTVDECYNLIDINTWHMRLGHTSAETIKRLTSCTDGITISDKIQFQKCEECLINKAKRKPFHGRFEKQTEKLAVVYADLCGPITPTSVNGDKYISGFIDDATRFDVIYTISKKSEAIITFDNYLKKVVRPGENIKQFHSDRGGEYISRKFEKLLEDNNISHTYTLARTPEHNSIRERNWGTLFTMATCMLKWAKLPMNFWNYAIRHAVYLRNRILTKGNLEPLTPYEKWFSLRPDLKKLRIFGCLCYVYIDKKLRSGKLGDRATKGIYVGHSLNSNGYKILIPTGKDCHALVESRNVDFDESKPGGILLEEEITDYASKILGTIEIHNDENDHIIEDYRPSNNINNCPRTQSIPDQNQPIQVIHSNESENLTTTTEENNTENSSVNQHRTSSGRISKPIGEWWLNNVEDSKTYYNIVEPNSYNNAVNGPNSAQWKEAIHQEFLALDKNGTFNLTILPENSHSIGVKWVFKIKRNSDNSIDKFKARLCAQGFTQIEGVDFNETFAPVVRANTTRIMAAIASVKKFQIYNYDIKSAYLYAKVEETIFMKLPQGFIEFLVKTNQRGALDFIRRNKHKTLVLQLLKSLYGLKQSGYNWDTLFTNWLISLNFVQSKVDSSMFYIINHELEEYCVLTKYVDDINLLTNSLNIKKNFEVALQRDFKITILGKLRWSLGIKIDQNSDQIIFSQEKYINDILTQYNLNDAKPTSTPANVEKFSKDQCPEPNSEEQREMKKVPYRNAIGSLLYLSTWTRPDITFQVQNLAKFVENPGRAHWTGVKRIMRFLKQSKCDGINFKSNGKLILEGYCDADWGSNTDTRKSTTGYIFTLGDGAITWRTRTQPTVALSSAEAEYMSLSEAVQEAIYLRKLLTDFGYSQTEPTIINIDNQSAMKIANHPVQHQRTKHIDIKHHFVRDAISNKEIKLNYLPTGDMPADLLTKNLAKSLFDRHRKTIMYVKDQESSNKETKQ